MGIHSARASVESFYQEAEELGIVTLEAYSYVDPLRCFYGWDTNCDEYLGYARRLVAAVKKELVLHELTWSLLVELVRRTFYPSQVIYNDHLGGYLVEPSRIEGVAEVIASHLVGGQYNHPMPDFVHLDRMDNSYPAEE